MSTVLLDQAVVTAPRPDVYTPSRTYVRPEPSHAPDQVLRERARPQAPSRSRVYGPSRSSKSGSHVAGVWLARTCAFAAISLLTCAGSSLAGQVMLERAHQDAVKAQQRAMVAKKSVALLQDQVNRLTSEKFVIGWAETHDMVVPSALLSNGQSQGGPGDQARD